MQGLVYIGKVITVYEIPQATRIESLELLCGTGGKWRGTAQKGQFKEGDTCQVYLNDALLPQTADFAFMEKLKWRVRMIRLKGVPSEVLVMPQSISGSVGDDVTELSGVTKYEKPIPLHMAGDALGAFPSFIPKTDEPNFQAVPDMVRAMRGLYYYSTIKVDGSSATVYKWEGHFGCCSRNLEMKDTPNNAIWKIARQYDLGNALQDGYALQFEVVGPGIQGNPLGLKQVEPRLFNVYHIEDRHYLDFHAVWKLFNWFPKVDVIDAVKKFEFETDEDLRLYAQQTYPNGKQCEGVVIRPVVEGHVNGERLSFKIINLLYSDK